jgi:hypothetical protein
VNAALLISFINRQYVIVQPSIILNQQRLLFTQARIRNVGFAGAACLNYLPFWVPAIAGHYGMGKRPLLRYVVLVI